MKEKNLRMTAFKALGIIVVVSCHLDENLFNLIGIPITSSRELFPEYSYHIPLFVFASGYFYKRIYESDYLTLVKKRFKNITKYYKANLFYFFLTLVLVGLGLLEREIHFNLHSIFIEPFLGGFQFYFNGPGWFVPFLFTVRIVFPLTRKFFSLFVKSFKFGEEKKLLDESMFTIFLCVVGLFAAHFANMYPVQNQDVALFHAMLRTAWGLQFMQIGLFYKEFVEEHIKYTVKGFVAIVATKAVFYRIFGYCTFSLRTVSFNGHTFISLFTSILGILYALYLAEFMCRLALRFKRKLPELINFVGNNTWSIMIHHLLIKWLLTQFADTGILGNSRELFDYFISPVLCLVLPLIFVYICNKVNEKIKENKELKQA